MYSYAGFTFVWSSPENKTHHTLKNIKKSWCHFRRPEQHQVVLSATNSSFKLGTTLKLCNAASSTPNVCDKLWHTSDWVVNGLANTTNVIDSCEVSEWGPCIYRFSFLVFKSANEKRITNSFFVFRFQICERKTANEFLFRFQICKQKTNYFFRFSFWKQTRRNCIDEVVYLSTYRWILVVSALFFMFRQFNKLYSTLYIIDRKMDKSRVDVFIL